MISRKNRRLRQAAAERVPEQLQGDAPGEITTCPDEDPGFAPEAMTELLEEVPAEAWQPIPAMSQVRCSYASPIYRPRRRAPTTSSG
ncbi:MAG: hypothetical protein WBP81_33665 [Solirubrobacteraceae bacterium]